MRCWESSVPAALVTYRGSSRNTRRTEAEAALAQLAEMYDDLRRYISRRSRCAIWPSGFPTTGATPRGGRELQKRVKDSAGPDSYILVPKASSRYRDAQKKLKP